MVLEAECAVVGAGVVGLACARALQLAGVQTLLIERHRAIGQETSARNSEVIHSGIYYPPGSAKARLCVRGRRMLYDYCRRRGVPHRALGKIVVAVDESELPALEQYERLALANAVADDDASPGLRRLDARDVRALEPALRLQGALAVPQTGILDSAAYLLALRHDFEQAGGDLVLDCPVESGHVVDGAIELQLGDAERTRLRVRRLVNSAGLHAPALAARIEGLTPGSVPTAHFAAGHYYLLSGPSPFSRLVYPIAVPGGLGVHVTLDMGGAVRFGPDVQWRDGIDYHFDSTRAPAFYEAIRRYYPGLPEGALQPGYVGVRPKISGPGEAAADFLLQDASTHGVAGLVNLFGIESPGLTSSLAIADEVCRALAG